MQEIWLWNKYTKIYLINYILLCVFPYFDNEAMSYLKSLEMDGRAEKNRQILQRKKNLNVSILPQAYCHLLRFHNINMSQQRSRACHLVSNNWRRLRLLPCMREGGGDGHSETIPSSPVAYIEYPGGPQVLQNPSPG